MSAEERARAWRHGQHEAVCDVLEPWEHGTVVRATRYPFYWDFNAVRVERDPGMEAAALAAVADEHLADAAHRRVDVDILERRGAAPAGLRGHGVEGEPARVDAPHRAAPAG